MANIADEITYYSHDLDDGLDHNLITVEQLEDLELWQICTEHVRTHFPKLEGKRFLSYVIRSLIDYEVDDLVAAAHARLEEAGGREQRRGAPLEATADGLQRPLAPGKRAAAQVPLW